MKKNKLFLNVIILCVFHYAQAQKIGLSGTILGDEDVEGIHVLNKTSLTSATSNSDGVFSISAKLNDTVIFSAVQYKTLFKVVSEENIASKALQVTLETFVNELDEVFLVQPLSGNLIDDVSNSEAKPVINFYNVGIPGYIGKQKTQSERRLFEATTGGGFIPLNPILNAISGRTKKLKEMIQLENDDALLARLKNDLSIDFFDANPLEQKYHVEFFYFVQEDPDFRKVCSKSNLEAFAFFKKKLEQYNQNLKAKE
ncbi:carboxypeptidase-like regulatory domain-containing protein [Olleya sp. Bg11-27]|uniref:carboxypeptidase-like regulatory domain-containing protein n=1 Tax=Olleya sp. Bg11-27 TaxID=2058135 RepID=UPI000C313C22|nr:carboxypeptidase-like regulatory domain-containing protein [Olleya sp. Bg11-27]AUC74163.1 hypothetical protein CW732_00105 [Olleya sp. Bg11-27]